jgi:hypothetical protein
MESAEGERLGNRSERAELGVLERVAEEPSGVQARRGLSDAGGAGDEQQHGFLRRWMHRPDEGSSGSVADRCPRACRD